MKAAQKPLLKAGVGKLICSIDQDNESLSEILPVKSLTASVAVRLILSFQGDATSRTNRKSRVIAVQVDLIDSHRSSKGFSGMIRAVLNKTAFVHTATAVAANGF